MLRMTTNQKMIMATPLLLILSACSGQVDKEMESEFHAASSLSENIGLEKLSSTEDLMTVTATSENDSAVCLPEFARLPQGSISINGGAIETASSIAVLELGGLEEILRMKISNDSRCECGNWEFYSPTKQWTLVPVDGVATVGVQYKDYEGRVTECAVATIRFNPPTTTTTTTLPPTTTTIPVVTTTTLPPTTTTLPEPTTTTTLPIVTTTTTLPPTTTTTLPVVTTTTTLPKPPTTTLPIVTTTTTLPKPTTTTTLPVVTTTTTLPKPPTTTVPKGKNVVQDHVITPGVRKADILIVIDNSGSMRYEQKSMADRMSTFLSQLKGLDWRIAITTTDPKHSIYGDGRLVQMSGLNGQYQITSAMDPSMAQKILGQTIQRKETGGASEQGIFVTRRALERSLEKSRNPNKEFFRPDAALSVIVITDENESKNNEKNQPQNLVNFVKTNWPSKSFNFHSIITRPGDIACLKGEGAKYGVQYDYLSRMLGAGTVGGSILGSVCERDYGSQLSGITGSTQNQSKAIQLQCAPLGNTFSSVQVQLNGSPYSGKYQVQNNRLVFEQFLPAGTYRLRYTCP